MTEPSFVFGPFRLVPHQRTLLQDDAKVLLGSRSLDVLIALVETPGEVVTKRELMSRAWPNMVVGDNSLKVAVSELRKVLGDDRVARRFLVNVPGRGYMFVAPVVREQAAGEAPLFSPSTSGGRTPCLPIRPIGRDDAIAAIADALQAQRLVSIVGTGGIGKTTVAVAVAEALESSQAHGVCFVDLGAVADPRFVPAALAQALGMVVHSEDVQSALALALRDRRMLIVLDSCERVLDVATPLVARILGAAPGVRFLTTSREQLRISGEWVHRLAPLAFPQADSGLSAAGALGFPAVQLFVERASASDARFAFSDADVALVADICSKLEGIPLAIELAATRVNTFTLRELAALLDDRLRLLALNWRGALPRHASLLATLDWSHELLAEDERKLLRRLSVFSRSFGLAGASAVAGDGIDVATALEGLVAKSLVHTDIGGAAERFRLLDATRTYAAQKLVASAEHGAVRRRHAEHQLALLTRAEQASGEQGNAQWLADHGWGIDDVRSAIAWAVSAEGDSWLGVALKIAALPLWIQQSLLIECRDNIEQVFADEAAKAWLGPREQMTLKAALGVALLHTRGPQPMTESLWTEALAIADDFGEVGYQLRMLWALPLFHNFAGDFRCALGYLRKFRNVAREHGDSVDRMSGERLMGTTLLYLGRLASARHRTEQMLNAYEPHARHSHIARFQFEPRSVARGTLANILWLQGQADQATQLARTAVDEAQHTGHPLSLLSALGQVAIPLALHVGDHAAAEQYLRSLRALLARHALAIFGQHAACLESIALLECGDLAGVPMLEEALGSLQAAGFHLRRTYYMCALAKGQCLANRPADALATIEAALAWCQRGGECWYLPEALRLKGELLGAQAFVQADACYDQSMQMARVQGALTWQLRTAMSRVRLHAGRPDSVDRGEALATLRAVHGRFHEGFDTADLREAARLLEGV